MIKETARRLLRLLRDRPEGATKEHMMQEMEVSAPTIQRALTWLRDHCDSPVAFDRTRYRWVLQDAHFTLPLSDPEPEDLSAVMFAEALLAPFADREILQRVRRLAEQMDNEIREQGSDAKQSITRPGALTATVTTASPREQVVLPTILRSLGKGVVRVRYDSPWSENPHPRYHEIEPWQLRVHDGVVYLRAYSRTAGEARSYRVGQIVEAEAAPELNPVMPTPPAQQIWGDEDPAFGIDHDRPDHARLVIAGPVARWVNSMIWHPRQEDRWLEEGQVLERRLPYRSCRELARRLLSLGDAVRQIDPPALREQVRSHAAGLAHQLGGM